MLGFMNREALDKTIAEKRVTFYSRSKKRLWTKGETSGHHLDLVDQESTATGIQKRKKGNTANLVGLLVAALDEFHGIEAE